MEFISRIKTCETREYVFFWEKYFNLKWEVDTLEFIKRNCDSNTHFYDIGSWIGPTALAAGAKGATVTAFEPDPKAYDELVKNIALNNFDIVAENKAVADKNITMNLHFDGAAGNSMSTLLKLQGGGSARVNCLSIDSLTPGAGKVKEVAKIDIEGFEYFLREDILLFVQRCSALNISLHPRAISGGKVMLWIKTAYFVHKLSWRFKMSLFFHIKQQILIAKNIFLKRPVKNFSISLELD